MASTLELMLMSKSQVMPVVQVFTSNGTWTKPDGALWVFVQVQGAGGGSGGVAATGAGQAACAAGGAGGEYAQGIIAASTLPSSVSITVGAGGTAATAGANNGGTGGTSSFGSTITAIGGGGGSGAAATSTNLSTGGSTGGTGGTGGDWRIAGGDGANGQVVGAIAVKYNNGGNSYMAGIRRATGVVAGTTTGFDGYAYGGGASGASNGASQSAAAGNTGGAGVVIVTTFFMA